MYIYNALIRKAIKTCQNYSITMQKRRVSFQCHINMVQIQTGCFPFYYRLLQNEIKCQVENKWYLFIHLPFYEPTHTYTKARMSHQTWQGRHVENIQQDVMWAAHVVLKWVVTPSIGKALGDFSTGQETDRTGTAWSWATYDFTLHFLLPRILLGYYVSLTNSPNKDSLRFG